MTAAAPPKDKFLAVQKRAEEIRAKYAETQRSYFNTLVMGDSGAGKTSLAATCPKPLFLDSFDPGGTKSEALQEGIANGDILCETRWETDSWKKPGAFREWEREMDSRKREGFFDALGTYVLDSSSKWSDSLMFAILQTNSRAGQNPQIQDYLVQQLTAVDWIGQLMSYPCNVLVTAHLGIEKDELTGKIESGPLMYGKLAKKLPIAFDECYVTRPKATPQGVKYQLQVHNDGYYIAKTRIGGSKFSQYEDPDVKALMRKAQAPEGSYTDKPSLFNS